MKTKFSYLYYIYVLQIVFLFCSSSAKNSIEKTGFLSHFHWGMTKEEVIKIVDEKDEFKLINNKIQFEYALKLQSKSSDSITIVIPFIYEFTFQGDRLVKIFRAVTSESITKDDFCSALNNAFVSLYDDEFGTPVKLNEETIKDNHKLIESTWQTDRTDLFMISYPDLGAISMVYYSKGYTSEYDEKDGFVISNLWFGIVEEDSTGEYQKVKETNEIPQDTTTHFALSFEIDSEEEINIKMGQKMPSEIHVMYDQTTGKRAPLRDGFYIHDFGNYSKTFFADMRLDEGDPLGKYKIKIYLNDNLTGMLTFDVVPQNK